MEPRLSAIEAIIPTLATREDLVRVENRLESKFDKAIHRLERQLKNTETSLHKDIHSQTWHIVKWMTGTLITLLPTLFAGVFYVARNIP